MHTLQFSAVNPPSEISDDESLLGRPKRPHGQGAPIAPGFHWCDSGADRPTQPLYVGPGNASHMSEGMGGAHQETPNGQKQLC